MPEPTLIAGPKRVVGGRFPVHASLYQFEDGRILQGLAGVRGITDAKAHAIWRAEAGHASDSLSEAVRSRWPEVAAMRER